MRPILLAATAALLTLSASAQAQDVIVTQPSTTTVVPSTTTVVEVPGEVRTYVLEQNVQSVPYEGDVLIGEVLPQSVETRVIDGNGNYAYTVVNERRVIVDPQTRQVIEILE
ncbi:DUF1236 domain-containing protein [Pararhizobium gei]|uniref:DUF1236 domain-containing protein n=1 Tax=Pararhizobium gei TaxID=1395951 RepID=UPI0023DCCA88|nr:DUF1236 domain-containing protein [Rhizobium gei]